MVVAVGAQGDVVTPPHDPIAVVRDGKNVAPDSVGRRAWLRGGRQAEVIRRGGASGYDRLRSRDEW